MGALTRPTKPGRKNNDGKIQCWVCRGDVIRQDIDSKRVDYVCSKCGYLIITRIPDE